MRISYCFDSNVFEPTLVPFRPTPRAEPPRTNVSWRTTSAVDRRAGVGETDTLDGWTFAAGRIVEKSCRQPTYDRLLTVDGGVLSLDQDSERKSAVQGWGASRSSGFGTGDFVRRNRACVVIKHVRIIRLDDIQVRLGRYSAAVKLLA